MEIITVVFLHLHLDRTIALVVDVVTLMHSALMLDVPTAR